MWHKGMELDGKSMKVGDFLRLRGTEPYKYVHLTKGDLDRLMAMPRDADVWFWEYEFDGDWYEGMGSVSNARIEVDWAETEAHNHGKR